MKLRALAIDALLPADHQARVVWRYVERLDLSAVEGRIKSVEGHAGRAATDPRLLLALWLFATLDGVGSARQVEKLCKEHLAYIWLCGDVHVGRSVLAEFRVGNEALLDELLVKSVASLRERGLVTLERVSQDGMRVRAKAGAGSFRRADRLETALAEARAQVQALKAELNSDPASSNRRRDAARLRGAADREKRLTEALAQMPQLEKVWARNQRKRGYRKGAGGRVKAKSVAERQNADEDDPGEPSSAEPENASPPQTEARTKATLRASSTDPDARVMKVSNSGFRPALNVQIATDVGGMVILAVDVCIAGSDAGLHTPMIDTIKHKYDRTPGEWLVDGGYPTLDSIQSMPDDCDLFAPTTKPRDPNRSRYARLRTDSQKVGDWRERMGTDEAKQIYKLRAATSEYVNAHMRNRRLRQFPVRGVRRARSVVLLHALAHNLMRTLALEGRPPA